MTMAEQLYAVGSSLPPAALSELLDFAEFLRQRCTPAPTKQQALLTDLMGGLEDSTTFTGLPLAIQEKLRREWD